MVKSNTQTLYLTGFIKWAKGLGEVDEKYNLYTAQFYPDDKSWDTFNSIKHGLKIKEDEDGKSFKIKREFSREFTDFDTGVKERRELGPPRVFMEESGGGVGLDPKTVGNGSKVTIKLLLFPSPKYGNYGSRLEAVRVDELIEFVPEATEDGAGAPF